MDPRYNRPQHGSYQDSRDRRDCSSPLYQVCSSSCSQQTRQPTATVSTRSTPPSSPPQSTMSSFFSRLTSSNEAQLAATAVVSGAVVAGAIFGYQHVRRQERVYDLKSSIPALDASHLPEKLSEYGIATPQHPVSKEDERAAILAQRAQKGDFDEDLILEQLARNRVFLSSEGLHKLRSAKVIVVGCGGVGSHCTAALARSGVSNIRLIDFDQVTLSSLNRHAVATLNDVGTSKVQCLRRRLEQITPWVRFDCRNQLFSSEVADELIGDYDGQSPDFVVDAIDNIDSKVALLAYCNSKKIPVISSMGAGCKSDPTRVVIGDISMTTEDPLSRSTRRRLRLLGIATGITAVYSTEKPGPGKAQLLPLPEEEFAKGSVGDLGVLPDFRVRILPVLGTMPAVFGYTAANHLILKLTGYPSEYVISKERNKMYDAILAQFQGAEEKLARTTTPGEDARGLKLPFNLTDIGYMVEEVYKGKSAVSGLSTRLALIRWRRPETSTVDAHVPGQKVSRISFSDIVCMTKEEAVVHEQEYLRGSKSLEDLYDTNVIEYVEARLQEDRGYQRYRF